TRALHAVVGQHTVPGLPAVLGQRDRGGRRRDVRDAALVEDRHRRLGLAGEGGADDADDLVADRLLGLVGRLRRVALGVILDQLDLLGAGLGVVLLDGQL